MGGLDLRDASISSLTDVGRVRQANEDSYAELRHTDGHCLLVVADGMGGHQGGATASQNAVKVIGEAFNREAIGPPDSLAGAITEVTLRIF